jgi:hypothetical protein
LSEIFSSILSETIDYILSPHVKEALVSKSLVVNGYIKSKVLFDFYVYSIFFYLLDAVHNVYTNVVSYDYQDSSATFYKGILRNAVYRFMCRRLMISNLALTPLIISEQTGTSSLGLPLYYPEKLNKNTRPALEHIVYIGNELPKLDIRLNILLKVFKKRHFYELNTYNMCEGRRARSV